MAKPDNGGLDDVFGVLCFDVTAVYDKLFYCRAGFTVVFLFVLSVIFVVAGGYVINDCFDVYIDKINRPDTVIVDRVLPKSTAYVYYWILNILGLCCSVVSGVRALKMSFFNLWFVSFYWHLFYICIPVHINVSC